MQAEHEHKAKYYYSRVTGNTVLPCGYVIDTTAPWLGTSPGGNVSNQQETHQALWSNRSEMPMQVAGFKAI